MKQPLVTRPAYREAPTATAQLPSGGPADRGRSLDSDIPGTSTFVKPLDDHGTDDTPDADSIYRKDGPRDLAKPQDGGDDTIDNSDASPGYMGLGEKDPNDYSKTKYPYRDGKPNQKNAADANFVAHLHILESKAPLFLTYQERTEARVASLAGIATKVADTAEQILAGLNPKFVERAKNVQVQVKRVDARNLRWIFGVQTSDKQYAVKLKAFRPRKNTTKLSKMDLELSCSCPAWQWLGPEYHATRDDYLLGKPEGTASSPDIRDPERHNNVCKHVAAVLNMTRDWEVPVSRPQIKKKR